jgi:hypothetical protein
MKKNTINKIGKIIKNNKNKSKFFGQVNLVKTSLSSR